MGKKSKRKVGQSQSPIEPELSLGCDQMEHLDGEQYSQYPVERNPRAYMSMRDYRNPPWVSAPSYMVPPQYAPHSHSQYASPSQPSTSPVEQAILDLTKLVGDVVEEQKKFNTQLNQRIYTVESSLNKKLDVLQSDLDQKIDILQQSISKLTNQHVHPKEESPEKVCMSDTMVEEQCQHDLLEGLIENFAEHYEGLSKSSAIGVAVCPWEKNSSMLNEEGSGKNVVEEHQEHNLHLPSTDPVYTVYIMAAAHSTPEALAPKVESIPSALPV